MEKISKNELDNVSGGCGGTTTSEMNITYKKPGDSKEYTERVTITHECNCGYTKLYNLCAEWCSERGYIYVTASSKYDSTGPTR